MLELKALLLTQGMHGMVSQVEGLARALGLTYKHQSIKLKPFWNLLPPKLTPISENLVKEKFVCDSKVIISCGRKSVIPSIALKKRLGKEIFTIHIQDPKVSLKHFDLVISPEHDNIKGDNVLTTKGAIHYLTKKEIKDNLNYLNVNKEKKKLVAFIIGGPNKYYNYNDQIIHQLFTKIKTLFTPDKYKIIIVPSYRTPEKIIKKAFDTFNFNHIVIKTVDKKAYLSALALAENIVVTCDSSSMISEAALTGKPIYIASILPKKKDKRFQRFRNLFRELNIIRNLGEEIEDWNYQKLDETNRVANIIKKKINS